jgi:hypothetical protein
MNLPEPAVQNSPHGALLTQFLAGRDAPCPVCRYNLRDLTGAHCPECGAPLVLAVGSHQARFGVLLLAIVPSVMMLTLALLIYAICLDAGWPPSQLWGVWTTIFLGPLEGLAAVWLYRRRAGFMRRRRAAQWYIVAATWSAHVVFWVVGMLHLLHQL